MKLNQRVWLNEYINNLETVAKTQAETYPDLAERTTIRLQEAKEIRRNLLAHQSLVDCMFADSEAVYKMCIDLILHGSEDICAKCKHYEKGSSFCEEGSPTDKKYQVKCLYGLLAHYKKQSEVDNE